MMMSGALGLPSKRAMIFIAKRPKLQLVGPYSISVLSMERWPMMRPPSSHQVARHQFFSSLDSNNNGGKEKSGEKKNRTTFTGIKEREQRLLQMLSSAQNLNQSDDIIKEFQTILLYYCNKIRLRNTVNNNNDLNGHYDFSSNESSSIEETAKNICKWTKEIIGYRRNGQNQLGAPSSYYFHIPWEPIVEALWSTQQVTYLKFADDLVLELANRLSQKKQKQVPANITKLLSFLITGWSKCDSNNVTDYEPAEKAEQWLLEWLRGYYLHSSANRQRRQSVDADVGVEFPNIHLFGAVIDAWAKSRKREAPFRAERILKLLLLLANNKKAFSQQTHHELVTSVLEEREPLFHCSMLIRKQNELHKQHVPQPNTVLYTSIIDAWSRSSHPMAATFAEKWLHHMEEEYFDRGNELARPNVVSYTAVISAFSRCSSYSPQEGNQCKPAPHAANRAESVLLRLLQVSSRERSRAGNTNGSDTMTRQQLSPDVFAYNGVISAWANMVGKDPNATKNCERWLNKMIEGGGEADVVTFNSVINAFAREAIYNGTTSCSRAEHWYTKMVSYGIEPTIITYGSLIKAWSNSRSPEGPERAEYWLEAYHLQQEKQQASGKGQLQDAVVLYNSVVNSWVTSGRPDALDGAIRIVSLMEESPSDTKLVPQPDVITYNTLLKGCSRSFAIAHDRNKRSKPRRVGPIQSNECEKALRAAITTYNKMALSPSISSASSRRVQPDSHTFSIILTCINRLTSLEEKKANPAYRGIVSKIFHDCCNLGMANDIVLSALKNACSCLPAQDGNLSFYTELTTANKDDSAEIGNDSVLEKRENESSTISDQWRVNVCTGVGRSHGAPTKRAMLLSRQKKVALRDSKF